MVNPLSCRCIISKHMYPLVLPKIAPFCMKITKKFLGEDPKPPPPPPPSITIVLDSIMFGIHIDNQMKFKHATDPFTYTLYAHVHTGSPYRICIYTGSLQKCKISHGNSCPASLLNQHSLPPQCVCGFFFLSKFCCG